MKVKFHLCSPSANCGHCTHLKSIPARGFKEDVDQLKINYCYIICSSVTPDYYCTFYRIKHTPKPKNETKNKTILPSE